MIEHKFSYVLKKEILSIDHFYLSVYTFKLYKIRIILRGPGGAEHSLMRGTGGAKNTSVGFKNFGAIKFWDPPCPVVMVCYPPLPPPPGDTVVFKYKL